MNKTRRTIEDLKQRFLPGHPPDFLIIGAQKSATVSLRFYLSQHPSLVTFRQWNARKGRFHSKEIHYFDKWINHGCDRKWYESHFKGISMPFRRRYYFEKTPRYIYPEAAPQQIARCYPGIRMLLVLRDPVPRAFSAWHHYYDMFTRSGGAPPRWKLEAAKGVRNPINTLYFEGRKEFPSFREAIELELSEAAPRGWEEPSILRRGLYARQIKNYYRYFAPEQILILGFRDVIRQTEATLERIYGFLGIPQVPFARLQVKAKNQRDYKFALSETDRRFLEEYYAGPNEELLELIGPVNW